MYRRTGFAYRKTARPASRPAACFGFGQLINYGATDGRRSNVARQHPTPKSDDQPYETRQDHTSRLVSGHSVVFFTLVSGQKLTRVVDDNEFLSTSARLKPQRPVWLVCWAIAVPFLS